MFCLSFGWPLFAGLTVYKINIHIYLHTFTSNIDFFSTCTDVEGLSKISKNTQNWKNQYNASHNVIYLFVQKVENNRLVLWMEKIIWQDRGIYKVSRRPTG